jgi:hypothetical protein
MRRLGRLFLVHRWWLARDPETSVWLDRGYAVWAVVCYMGQFYRLNSPLATWRRLATAPCSH